MSTPAGGSSSGDSSLDLLNVSSDTSSPPALTETEEYLRDLTVTLFDETLNKRNYTTPLLYHWDPNMEQQVEILEPVVGRHDILENIKALHTGVPNYHMEVINSTAKVTERTGRATVWILQLVHGLPEGVPIESVNVLSWVRKDGEWFCTKHKGIRGLCAGFPSSFDMPEP